MAEQIPSYHVAKPFQTATRVFTVDQPVARDDVAGAAMCFDDYVAKGFIAAADPGEARAEPEVAGEAEDSAQQ